MHTYKQNIKDESRRLIWNHAIRSLTQNRNNVRILNPNYMDNLWDFVKESFDSSYGYDSSDLIDERYEDWKTYADDLYGQRKADELKVAFFCGPEPENDVKHLLRLGIRLENMYAFEFENEIFKHAVQQLHLSYPQLKIYKGKIEDFVSLNEVKFDVVYLDFMGPLFRELKSVFTILESNALSDLSILAINTCYPEQNDENIKLLTTYFYNSNFFEYCALNGYDEESLDVYNADGRFIEGCFSHGYSFDEVKQKITNNFEAAYSVFQTRFITVFSNLIKPVHEAVNSKILRERIFTKEEELKKVLANNERYNELLKNHFESDQVLMSYMYLQLSEYIKPLKHHLSTNSPGAKFNHFECIKLLEMFVNSIYEQFKDILSEPLNNQLKEITHNLVGGRSGLFCDVPLPYLWLELLIYGYGHSYHQNTQNHRRYSYTAKEHKMCIDVFTLDKCRPLYDSMPMIEYLGADLSDTTRQFITRMCIDAIGKQSLHILNEMYFGSALIGIGERPWANNYYFPNRIEIKLVERQTLTNRNLEDRAFWQEIITDENAFPF